MSTDILKELVNKFRKEIDEDTWKRILAKFEEQEDDMETIKSAKAEVIAKPMDVEEFADKVKASKMTKEEMKKHIEDNVIDEFND